MGKREQVIELLNNCIVGESVSNTADKILVLFNVVGQSEQLVCDCKEWFGWNLIGNCAACDKPKNFD
jgi:hypothetical protein